MGHCVKPNKSIVYKRWGQSNLYVGEPLASGFTTNMGLSGWHAPMSPGLQRLLGFATTEVGSRAVASIHTSLKAKPEVADSSCHHNCRSSVCRNCVICTRPFWCLLDPKQ